MNAHKESMEIFFFMGDAPLWRAESVQLFHEQKRPLAISRVIYQDLNKISPSCCEWIIPGTWELYENWKF
jgi:hypothetical protein